MKKLMTWFMAMLMVLSVSALPASAHCHYYRSYYSGYDNGGYFYNHPYVKKALIGGGIGALAGGLIGGRGDVIGSGLRGALIGAGAGLGYEYLRQRGVFSGGNRYYNAYPSSYGYGRPYYRHASYYNRYYD